MTDLLAHHATALALRQLGERKLAADLHFSGKLQVDSLGDLVLDVPSALLKGCLAALKEPGIELYLGENWKARIIVMSREELSAIGGPRSITERGKDFDYRIGQSSTAGHDVGKIWYLEIQAPDLVKLRQAYGLVGEPIGGFQAIFGMRKPKLFSDGSKVMKDLATKAIKSFVPVSSGNEWVLKKSDWKDLNKLPPAFPDYSPPPVDYSAPLSTLTPSRAEALSSYAPVRITAGRPESTNVLDVRNPNSLAAKQHEAESKQLFPQFLKDRDLNAGTSNPAPGTLPDIASLKPNRSPRNFVGPDKPWDLEKQRYADVNAEVSKMRTGTAAGEAPVRFPAQVRQYGPTGVATTPTTSTPLSPPASKPTAQLPFVGSKPTPFSPATKLAPMPANPIAQTPFQKLSSALAAIAKPATSEMPATETGKFPDRWDPASTPEGSHTFKPVSSGNEWVLKKADDARIIGNRPGSQNVVDLRRNAPPTGSDFDRSAVTGRVIPNNRIGDTVQTMLNDVGLFDHDRGSVNWNAPSAVALREAFAKAKPTPLQLPKQVDSWLPNAKPEYEYGPVPYPATPAGAADLALTIGNPASKLIAHGVGKFRHDMARAGENIALAKEKGYDPQQFAKSVFTPTWSQLPSARAFSHIRYNPHSYLAAGPVSPSKPAAAVNPNKSLPFNVSQPAVKPPPSVSPPTIKPAPMPANPMAQTPFQKLSSALAAIAKPATSEMPATEAGKFPDRWDPASTPEGSHTFKVQQGSHFNKGTAVSDGGSSPGGGSHSPLRKKADINPSVQLQPHQQALADEIDPEHPARKLMMWQVGSGKTLGSMAAAEAFGQPYTVVGPAAIRPTFKAEQKRFTDQSLPSQVISYQKAMQEGGIPHPDSLVIDEAQRIVNPGSRQSQAVQEAARKAKQVLLLSGTPIINRPGDLAPIVSILTNRETSPAAFEQRYMGQEAKPRSWAEWASGKDRQYEPVIRHRDELKAMLEGKVDYYAPSTPNVPTKTTDHEVEMGQDQAKLYGAMFGKIPWKLRLGLDQSTDMTPSELKQLRSFLSGPRQVGLSDYPFASHNDPLKSFYGSTKLQLAFKNLQEKLQSDERNKAFVYSNFPRAGLQPYRAALEHHNIPYTLFDGSLSDPERDAAVRSFNEGRSRVALVGPAGAEGISLRGAQLAQLLDPHWQEARSNQAKARVNRFDSHTNLPVELQNMEVQRYISKLPGNQRSLLQALRLMPYAPQPKPAADDYLLSLSEKKERSNRLFLDLLKEVGTRKQATVSPLTGGAAMSLPPLVVDRPKGFKKTFMTQTGPMHLQYPVDYGYFDGHINPDDNQGADVFFGTGGEKGLHGRFMKGTDLTGTWKPEERKWYANLTPDEHKAVLNFYGQQNPKLLADHVSFQDHASLLKDLVSLQQSPRG